MNAQQPSIGLIGLGTMGAALALNIAENGFAIAVFNRTVSRIPEFVAAAGDLGERITPSQSLEEFVAAIARPRRIILMVPAGKVVDDQIAAFDPLLDEGDIIIDCGNANFRETRTAVLRPLLTGRGSSWASVFRVVRRARGTGLPSWAAEKSHPGMNLHQSSRQSRQSTRMVRLALRGWARAVLAISSRWSITASNMPTCR